MLGFEDLNIDVFFVKRADGETDGLFDGDSLG
jgi:hypothetical protein